MAAADERASITIDVDVKNLNRLQQVSAALEQIGVASELNASKFNNLTGAMGKNSAANNKATASSQALYKKMTLLERSSSVLTKQARKLMFAVIAMSAEFAVSALALASVNGLFVIGKVVMQGYRLAMGALSVAFAAVGVAAMTAAAAFQEFQTAQFAFRYTSDNVTNSLDKSSFALRSLQKDTQLSVYGMKALAGAFAAVSKNSTFSKDSKEMLKAFSDFAASSGDPAKGLQAAANAIGLIQKKQVGVGKNSKNLSAEAINAIKQINPALADLAKKGGVGGTGGFGSKEKFIEMLLSGELAKKAGVSGAADAMAGTLVSQFKSYITMAFVELSDEGQRLLNPMKELLNTVFKGITRTFRRISNDLVSFGSGPFISVVTTLTEKMENFSVLLIRKYLPTSVGFLQRMENIFGQLKTFFTSVTNSLQGMREGGSIVIKTFGGPILEVFKQIGNNARSLADLATKNKQKFLDFGEALTGVVKSFFEMSAAFRNMFTQALPFINAMLGVVERLGKALAFVMNLFARLGPIAAAIGVSTAVMGVMKGTRGAQRRGRYGKNANSLFPGYKQVSAMDAAKQNLKLHPMANDPNGGSPGSAMTGAMATAFSQQISPATSSLHEAGAALQSAASSLTSSAATVAAGASLKGGMGGGTVDSLGMIKKLPARRPGFGDDEYFSDIDAWKKRIDAAKSQKDSGNPAINYINGETVIAGSRPIPNLGQYTGFTPQALGNTALQAALHGPKPLPPQNLLTGTKYSNPLANFVPGQGFSTMPYPTSPVMPYSPGYDEMGASRMSTGQRFQSALRNSKSMDKLKLLMLGTDGVTGAMPGGGGGTGGAMNVVTNSQMPIVTRAQSGLFGVAKNRLGRAAFGGNYKGLGIGNSLKNFAKSESLGRNYTASISNQYDAHVEAGGDPSTFKPNRKAAARAGIRNNMSGLGFAAAAGGGYLANKFGTDEAKGSLMAGAGMLAVDPKLGVAVGGLGAAATAKTRLGGVGAGALGGAAAGMKISEMLPIGPTGKLIGAGVGAVVGATFGFVMAGRNQAKMVKEAGKNINMAQLGALAAEAITGKGSTIKVRKKMLETQTLADDFRKQTTETGRADVLKKYSTGPDAILSGNTLSNATGKNSADMQKQLDENAKSQKKLIPLYDTFDKRMKLLSQTTGMTSDQIAELALEKNVNLYDSSVKMLDITSKLGMGVAKTGKQMRDAFTDIRVSALKLFDDFAKGKEIKDALQGAGESLITGDGTVQELGDYLNKLGSFLDFQNPSSPLGNVVSTISMLGGGSNFGKGKDFQTGGVMSTSNLTPEAVEIGNKYTSELMTKTSTTLADQVGSQLLGSGLQGGDPSELRKQIKNRTTQLLGQVNVGSMAGATDQQKTAAEQATLQLEKIETLSLNPTAFQNKDPAVAQKLLEDAFGGTFNTLEKIKEVTVAFDEESLESTFLRAIEAGYNDLSQQPAWWNLAPTWWSYKFNPATGKFEQQGDTSTPRRGLVGDTKTPRALGATMSAHSALNSRITGKRMITSSFRTDNLGSPSSDHAAGRAYDLTGQNLGQYASMTKQNGGFAEFHGSASSRHLHVVPALGHSGDTSSPVGARAGASGGNYTGGDISITVIESKDAKATAREVAAEIISMQRNERRRM